MKFLKDGIRFLLNNSIFLIVGTIIALFFANLAGHYYHGFLEYEFFEGASFHFLVNDVLMTFFFALAAKEIWEALLPGGALSSPKKAATPLLATAGGVIGPALIYIAGVHIFSVPDLSRGWAIPCATDIAFSYLVARLVFGKNHPAIPFLLLLAIADDAAGLIILAVAYPTGEIHLVTFFGLVVGAILFNIFILKKWLRVANFWWYIVIAGPVAWFGFFKGGIHPALALVPIIPTLPHKHSDIGFFEGTEDTFPRDPLNRFEHWWKNPVEFILMLFGFANAGVALSSIGLATGFVSVGLLFGKPIGIVLMTLLAVKVFNLEMPTGMNYRDLTVLGIMAGIGFTVALFVSTVAFPPGDVLDSAKMGALFSFFASFLSFIAAYILRSGRFALR